MDTTAKTVPEGFKLHEENSTSILVAGEAFLNPVQEFNRDLSVACITAWSELFNAEKEETWKKSLQRQAGRKSNKKRKVDEVKTEVAETEKIETDQPQEKEPVFIPQKITILEALSATGLRSIRYAKEIPHVKYVIANDLSPDAVEAIKRNVTWNDIEMPEANNGKIRVNQGDACTLMYSHREDAKRVDVVDLDPYGTAAPFIDAGIQSVRDGGLLCITCTDLAILATNNYPEKCLSNYGGVSMKSEYSHESALRLLLHALSTSASRYGRYIEPLVSLSIDFYIRVFVRIHTSPLEVKKVITKTATFYVCASCQAWYEQPLGRVIEKKHEKSGNVNYLFKTHTGIPNTEHCPECNSNLHLAGPMWSGPIHSPAFISKVLSHVSAHPGKYGTEARMTGMLTVAKEELPLPFYFTPRQLAGFFHCTTPSIGQVASALFHGGHQVSRSHASAGSLKTTATRAEIYDIFRSYVKLNPVKMENISEHSPARKLLSKEPLTEADFKWHAGATELTSSKFKLVRYQENPTSHWGPGSKPQGKKRKAED
ncbi:N2,N2-dimethylguanosine tRNA methyltransferase [Cylindrobasidium torrendii FP15055 ss-10]|uniref:tRNA (guanine(26)-N(2))-dimethyltransferase n=1 Tax=Cylindrobasidium torrendii FP15055 ss-10 TaxID=1314674 RepID=A0A0D7BNJ2_9AGAR|nr:N2,N2-dimethylguanosine tRNA methyltransferase [Cylindrobasidium torrendii FP15055 ss-10]